MTGDGATLRTARLAAGVSLKEMAALTFYSESLLSRVERGLRTLTPEIRFRYEQVLGDAVYRRELLTGAAGAVVPLALSSHILKSFQEPGTAQTSLDDWRGKAAAYGREYMRVPAAELQTRLAADLIDLQRQSESPALWGVAAYLLNTYGKTMPGSERALGWYGAALSASDRSGDTAVRVWTRGRVALQLGYEGSDPAQARVLARQALALSDKPSTGKINAHTAIAHAAALDGNTAECEEQLTLAWRTFDKVNDSEQISDHAIPGWRIATSASLAYARLGSGKTIRAGQTAAETRPGELPRFGVHTDLHAALMMVKAGDRAGGVAHARQSMASLRGKASLSLQLLLSEIERG
ncbi:helix-turn-helix domain-containing protein [Longispora albida]|uniref:helix-turn-helix domain-containing protein n=1 Tax=Longispora albida TaxID=203523 RepID=UPI00037AEB89|nr:helix-turn-helix transcriptional regulator [Longispora albida]